MTNVAGTMTPSPKKHRILIADSHSVMRDGLRAVIEQDAMFEVIAEASTGKTAVEAFDYLRPDVVLIDLQIQDAEILQTVMELRKISNDGALILMSTYPDESRVEQVLGLGATSCFLKTATGDEILYEIRLALDLAGRSGR
ncbi:response regulator transcription factor [Pinirhizobacter sp.]|jgi:DNA-binding NarL/FixJ family response regulator|uniref:response regulator n=1 Tax=Pinirhizobacter sp. TaxID=2950432 RepID=UPI002F4160C4